MISPPSSVTKSTNTKPVSSNSLSPKSSKISSSALRTCLDGSGTKTVPAYAATSSTGSTGSTGSMNSETVFADVARDIPIRQDELMLPSYASVSTHLRHRSNISMAGWSRNYIWGGPLTDPQVIDTKKKTSYEVEHILEWQVVSSPLFLTINIMKKKGEKFPGGTDTTKTEEVDFYT